MPTSTEPAMVFQYATDKVREYLRLHRFPRCAICDHNESVYRQWNTETPMRWQFLCAPCAAFLLSERVQPVYILDPHEAAEWLKRQVDKKYPPRAQLYASFDHEPGVRLLREPPVDEALFAEHFSYFEIRQEFTENEAAA